MKKTGLILAALLCCIMGWAQNYGILVNGKIYFAADYKGPDGNGEGFEEYLAHVQVSNGDYCQLYDANNKAAWAKPLNSYSEAGFSYDEANQRYNVSTSGCFDFYIKLKWEKDELYIGPSSPGTVCGEGQDISGGGPVVPGYGGSAPANCPDVMLQAFYWNSTGGTTGEGGGNGYGRTKWIDHLNGTNGSSAEEMGQWFDLIWLPPSSKATGGTGYLPIRYDMLDSDWGTKANLLSIINTFHYNGARVVADMVLNHCSSSSGWCKLSPENFGAFGTFAPDMSWICSTDEAFTEGHCTDAAGNPDDGYGPESNYESGRDWDHTASKVREFFSAYESWLIETVGYDGFRYDYCKGFHNSHINEYNNAAKAYFSVMEYWDGDVNVLWNHICDAGQNTLTFDFATKYTAFNNGIGSGNYNGCRGAGLPGAGKSRYAVTFLDSHDSFQRDDNEFLGKNNSMKNQANKDKVMQCNAYLLSMPGIPCIFYPHWVTFKDDLKKLINARYKAGVHSESAVNDESGNGYYKATISGTNGAIRLLLGPNSGYNTTPQGFTLAAKGNGWGVYYQMVTPRGDKCDNRTPIRGATNVGIQNVEEQRPQATKVIENGQLYLIKNGHRYNALGQQVK